MEEIKLKLNPDKTDRLGIRERNFLQVELIKKMLADGRLKTEADWLIHPYSKVVSQVIDNPENKEVRALANENNFTEAAEIVEQILIRMNVGSLNIDEDKYDKKNADHLNIDEEQNHKKAA